MKRTIFGTVTDFEGKPLPEAQIRVQGRNYKLDIASVLTDSSGDYRLDLEGGDYLAVWICKGYKEENLEYWAWNIPLYRDLELNARIGKLEIYALEAISVHKSAKGHFMLYFRPMSIRRHKLMSSEKPKSQSIIDIAPLLDTNHVLVSLDGTPMEVMRVDRVVEQHGASQAMYASLASVRTDDRIEPDKHYRFDVEITDSMYGDKGEATLFWKMKRYIK